MKWSVELLSRETTRIDSLFQTAYSLAVYTFEWFSQQATLTFLHPYFAMRKLKSVPCRIDRNHFPNFSKLQLLRLLTTFVTNRSWSLVYIQLYSTWFMFIEFVLFKLVVAFSFLVARVIKNTRRKPFEFKLPEVRFNRKQTSMDHPSVPYNKLLTNLASSSRTGEYWPSVVLYGPRCARSVLPRPRANIPRYGPRARLVRG